MRATLGGPRRPAPAAAPAGPSMVAIRCGLVERRNTAEERRKKTPLRVSEGSADAALTLATEYPQWVFDN